MILKKKPLCLMENYILYKKLLIGDVGLLLQHAKVLLMKQQLKIYLIIVTRLWHM